MAERREFALDAMGTITLRLAPARFFITPSVLTELSVLMVVGKNEAVRQAARNSLTKMREWGFSPLNALAVDPDAVEQIATNIRNARLIPFEEVNDSLLLVEAAVVKSAILITSDRHLRELDFERASLLLGEFGLKMPVIASPRDLVRKFG